MHLPLRLTMAVVLLAICAACARTVNIDEERNALLAVDREWSQTTKDPEKFTSYFADGGSIYAPGMPIVTGGDAIRRTVAEMHKAPGFALSWTPTKADVATSGDIGVTTGNYEMTMGSTSEKGKYVTAWRKDAGGAWKVTHDIFNADAPPKPPASTHVMIEAGALQWGDAPPGMPAGMRMAVVSGDPSQPEPYVLRAQMPANYRIAAHWHPTTENITVLSGTVALAMGEKLDDAATQDVAAGGFVSLPAEMRHTFLARTASTIQVHGIGPFAITYVNPADDPRTKPAN